MGQQLDKEAKSSAEGSRSQSSLSDKSPKSVKPSDRLEALANWFRKQMKLSDDQIEKLLILCTALAQVPQDTISQVIFYHATIFKDDLQYMQGDQIEEVLQSIISYSPDHYKVQDLPLVANYFKQYLQIHRKMNIQYIEAHMLTQEILTFQNGFPMNTLKHTNQQEEGKNKDKTPSNLKTKQQTFQNYQQEEQTSRTQREAKQLIQEFKSLLQEQGDKDLETHEDLKRTLDLLKNRLSLVDQLLTIQLKKNGIEVRESIETLGNEKVDNRFRQRQDQTASPPQSGLMKRREKGLLEIFRFYSRQHVLKGRKMNFEEIEKEGNTMNKGEFFKFCADFNITLGKNDLMELYRKKSLRENNPLIYETFKELLEEIFRMIRDQAVENKRKDIKIIEQSMHQVVTNSKDPHAAQDMQKKRDQVLQEIQELERQANFMDQAHEQLHSENPAEYGKIMKGFIIPFGCSGEKLNEMTFLTSSVQNSMKALGLRVSISAIKQQKDEIREKIKQQSIGRINQLRNQKQLESGGEGRTYSLAQLRNIKNSKDLFLGDKELENVLGISKDQPMDEPILMHINNKDGYNYSFKPDGNNSSPSHKRIASLPTNIQKNNSQPGNLTQQQQQSRNMPPNTYNGTHRKQPSLPYGGGNGSINISQSYQQPTVNLQAQNYHSKIMSRANQLDKLNKDELEQKKQKALDMHMRRVKVNKTIVEAYNENEKYMTRNPNKSVIYGGNPQRNSIHY